MSPAPEGKIDIKSLYHKAQRVAPKDGNLFSGNLVVTAESSPGLPQAWNVHTVGDTPDKSAFLVTFEALGSKPGLFMCYDYVQKKVVLSEVSKDVWIMRPDPAEDNKNTIELVTAPDGITKFLTFDDDGLSVRVEKEISDANTKSKQYWKKA